MGPNQIESMTLLWIVKPLMPPELMDQEKPDLTNSATIPMNQCWPCHGTCHKPPARSLALSGRASGVCDGRAGFMALAAADLQSG
jgi:hypothetical protein